MTSNMTPDQTAALRGLVTYLCDAFTTTGEIGSDQAADIINRLRVFDPAETGMVQQFRDTIASLAVTTPEPAVVEVTRAQALVDLARARGVADDDLADRMMDVLEGDAVDPSDDVARFIRDQFHGDDDFDDFHHEVDHLLGHCTDDDPDCPNRWADDDDYDADAYNEGNAGLD